MKKEYDSRSKIIDQNERQGLHFVQFKYKIIGFYLMLHHDRVYILHAFKFLKQKREMIKKIERTSHCLKHPCNQANPIEFVQNIKAIQFLK